MTESTKSQVDLVKKYSKIKIMYLELKSSNQKLEEVVNTLRKRWKKTDQQRFDLIKMFKNSVTRNQELIHSLQKENTNLQCTIQDQNQLIQEYSNTIDKLNKEISLLKLKSKSEKVANPVKNGIIQEHNGNISILNHPSFDLTDETKSKKRRTKSQILSQFRWSNLDIKVKGRKMSKEKCAIKTEDSSIKSQNKRKLYCEDDSVIDLVNDEG